MSVLIKGMEMPTHCTECDFWHDGVFEHCLLNMEVQNEDVPFNEGEYPDGCPLIEIPLHGDLIDADKLVELCDIMANKCVNKCDGIGATIWHQFKATVEWSPIVIPAEEGE